ncbi:MAG: hypothetical protein COB42_05525 [Sulfurimonas sp.]|nr:MAG: hypothetical protein COB42_05525 [Sulfurimonas sp.]
MSTLKRHNHRIHPCKNEKKEELLGILLEKNLGKKIIVVGSEKLELSLSQENVSFVSDKELYNTPELRCELLISFDLPQQAVVYMSRITKSDSHALILLDPAQEKLLHPIETLNGRTIMQEAIEGFSEEIIQKQVQPSKKDFNPSEERKREFVQKNEKPKYDKPKYDSKNTKPSKEKKPWDKKENKFLGKDEKGKAIFSAKSGERNHRYDGAPKGKALRLTGKKINIKTLKKNKDD